MDEDSARTLLREERQSDRMDLPGPIPPAMCALKPSREAASSRRTIPELS